MSSAGPCILLLAAKVGFASEGDDNIIPTIDKVRENFMDGFTGLCVEDLLARSVLLVGRSDASAHADQQGF